MGRTAERDQFGNAKQITINKKRRSLSRNDTVHKTIRK